MALGAPNEIESLSVSARKPLMSNGSAKARLERLEKNWRRCREENRRVDARKCLIWRRGRDSNPRRAYTLNRFRVRRCFPSVQALSTDDFSNFGRFPA